MDAAVIRIRYRDLPPGLHAMADVTRRGTIIYLMPGLTPAQRNAALRRLRQEARMGLGPELPRRSLAIALAAERVRGTVRNIVAIVRLHPAGSTLPLVAIGSLTALFLLTSVSVHVLRASPRALGQPPVLSTGGGALPGDGGTAREPRGGHPGYPGAAAPRAGHAPRLLPMDSDGPASGPPPGRRAAESGPAGYGPGGYGPGSPGSGAYGSTSSDPASFGSGSAISAPSGSAAGRSASTLTRAAAPGALGAGASGEGTSGTAASGSSTSASGTSASGTSASGTSASGTAGSGTAGGASGSGASGSGAPGAGTGSGSASSGSDSGSSDSGDSQAPADLPAVEEAPVSGVCVDDGPLGVCVGL